MKNPIDGLLQEEVDRKQFLARVGVAGLAAFGVGSVVKSLTDQPKGSGDGYGASAYGGERKLGKINRKVN